MIRIFQATKTKLFNLNVGKKLFSRNINALF